MSLVNRTKNATRNIVWGVVNKVVLLVTPFVIRTIIIKSLGTDYLGLSSLFSSILQVLNVTEMGFSATIVYCLYKPIANDDRNTINQLLRFYRKVYCLIGIMILVIGSSLSPFLPKLIKGTWPTDINIYYLYWLYLINTAASYLLFAYKSALLIAHQRNDIEEKISIAMYMAQYAIQIVVLLVFKNYYVFVIVSLLFTVFGNITRSIIVDRKYPWAKCGGKISRDLKKDIGKRVSGALIQKLCATTRNSLDSIFVSAYLGLTVITIYGNYFYILTAVHGVIYIIINGMTAGVGDSIAREDITKNHHDMMKYSFFYSWISGWCTCCLLSLYQPFMELWVGKELKFPFSSVILFCVYFYSLTIGDVRTTYITGAGLWWEGRFRSITETVVNIGLNAVLGYFFGVNGIILATIISILGINFVWGTLIAYKYYFKGIKPSRYYLLNIYYFLVTTLVTTGTYLLICQIHIGGLLGLAVKLLVCSVVSNSGFFCFYRKSRYYPEIKQFIKRIGEIKAR